MQQKKCYICADKLGGYLVRDDCHLTGKFRAAAHESSNMNNQIPNFFPLTFHSLSGYDSHLFINKLKAKCEDKDANIKWIAKNEKNYITFGKIMVVDSIMKEVVKKQGWKRSEV